MWEVLRLLWELLYYRIGKALILFLDPQASVHWYLNSGAQLRWGHIVMGKSWRARLFYLCDFPPTWLSVPVTASWGQVVLLD